MKDGYQPDHSPIICHKCGKPRSGLLNILGHLDDHRVCLVPNEKENTDMKDITTRPTPPIGYEYDDGATPKLRPVAGPGGSTRPTPPEGFEYDESPTPKLRPVQESAGATLARLGTDASLWATEFLKRNTNWDITHETLRGWFANAIGAGESVGYVRGIHEHSDIAASVRDLTK